MSDDKKKDDDAFTFGKGNDLSKPKPKLAAPAAPIGPTPAMDFPPRPPTAADPGQGQFTFGQGGQPAPAPPPDDTPLGTQANEAGGTTVRSLIDAYTLGLGPAFADWLQPKIRGGLDTLEGQPTPPAGLANDETAGGNPLLDIGNALFPKGDASASEKLAAGQEKYPLAAATGEALGSTAQGLGVSGALASNVKSLAQPTLKSFILNGMLTGGAQAGAAETKDTLTVPGHKFNPYRVGAGAAGGAAGGGIARGLSIPLRPNMTLRNKVGELPPGMELPETATSPSGQTEVPLTGPQSLKQAGQENASTAQTLYRRRLRPDEPPQGPLSEKGPALDVEGGTRAGEVKHAEDVLKAKPENPAEIRVPDFAHGLKTAEQVQADIMKKLAELRMPGQTTAPRNTLDIAQQVKAEMQRTQPARSPEGQLNVKDELGTMQTRMDEKAPATGARDKALGEQQSFENWRKELPVEAAGGPAPRPGANIVDAGLELVRRYGPPTWRAGAAAGQAGMGAVRKMPDVLSLGAPRRITDTLASPAKTTEALTNPISPFLNNPVEGVVAKSPFQYGKDVVKETVKRGTAYGEPLEDQKLYGKPRKKRR